MKTQNGYEAFEVVSALQKAIRRGDEEHALYWALELEASAPSWLWARLRVIAQEDVGLADPTAMMIVHVSEDAYERARKAKKKGLRLAVINAVLALVRAPKSRLADHAMLAMDARRRRGWRPEIPDYAKDKHTRAGRALGRTWKHFVDEAARLENRAGIRDPYETEATEYLLGLDARGEDLGEEEDEWAQPAEQTELELAVPPAKKICADMPKPLDRERGHLIE